ncbi:MAG: phosphate ABC transporter substrate-binding protein [Verrucomicrobiota bacterium JB022]|nr:phosphate ABC transporter substrate-binding protein [Verrucomicrobiota bacterium JB022]
MTNSASPLSGRVRALSLFALLAAFSGCQTDGPATSTPARATPASQTGTTPRPAPIAPAPTPAPAPVTPPPAPAPAAEAPKPMLPSYQPQVAVSGRLRSVGSDTMDKMMELWEGLFRQYHRRLNVLHQGRGSSTAIPALMEGSAEVGPMSRELKQDEIAAFQQRYGYPPTQIRVALDALGIYVHPSNPIAQRGLTLAELDAIFSSTRARGHGEAITTWGQLGLTGEWANAPINPYGRNNASGTYGFFRDEALQRGEYRPGVREQVGSAEVVDAVGNDRYGIGYSGIGYRTPAVATVPLKANAASRAYQPTEEDAASGNYALARFLNLALNIAPNTPPSDLQREFVTFILSREGQQLVTQDGYYPLTPKQAAEQLAKLGLQVAEAKPLPPAIAALGAYEPEADLQGRLRSVGSDTMDNMMGLWEATFRGYHQGLRVLHQGRGSSTAVPALMEGSAEVGPMSRPLKADEIAAFKQRFGYEPTQLRVAVDALALYVHPSNPLLQRGLTLEQLDAIFSSTRARGGEEDITTWGQLGLTGEWANAPIRVYSRNRASGTYGMFKDQVLAAGDFKPSNSELASSEAVVEAVGADKFAIGYSGIGYRTPNVAALPVSGRTGASAIAPSEETAFSGTYPLARALYLVINYNQQEGLSPLTREFLRFIYSAEGQALVMKDGYYPVNATMKATELKKVGL